MSCESYEAWWYVQTEHFADETISPYFVVIFGVVEEAYSCSMPFVLWRMDVVGGVLY
jgi:lipid-A-disaccharide synthase-like uncharacterized protein